MNHRLLALAFQEPTSDSSMWIIIIAVVVLLFFVVVIVVVGLAIFLFVRKRNKARAAEGAAALAGGAAASMPAADYAATPYAEASYSPAPAVAEEAVLDPALSAADAPNEEIRADAATPAPVSGELEFDPSRTVAINRESTVAISYGTIRFVSGVLAGQEFNINPEGSYIGREASLSQIVVPDPRISKRHLWIGVKDGLVRIVDQESRNGTFVNDPKSERITEATLTTGDTVILGESDVARFEYQM